MLIYRHQCSIRSKVWCLPQHSVRITSFYNPIIVISHQTLSAENEQSFLFCFWNTWISLEFSSASLGAVWWWSVLFLLPVSWLYGFILVSALTIFFFFYPSWRVAYNHGIMPYNNHQHVHQSRTFSQPHPTSVTMVTPYTRWNSFWKIQSREVLGLSHMGGTPWKASELSFRNWISFKYLL